jgi:very-short-patch-repair endonuclease
MSTKRRRPPEKSGRFVTKKPPAASTLGKSGIATNSGSPSTKRGSDGEETLALHLRAAKIPFDREVMFWPGRRWRADFVLPEHMIIVEVEGGVWSGGRHTRGSGFELDCVKYAHAAILGYRVMRFSTGQVASGAAFGLIEAACRRGVK